VNALTANSLEDSHISWNHCNYYAIFFKKGWVGVVDPIQLLLRIITFFYLQSPVTEINFKYLFYFSSVCRLRRNTIKIMSKQKRLNSTLSYKATLLLWVDVYDKMSSVINTTMQNGY